MKLRNLKITFEDDKKYKGVMVFSIQKEPEKSILFSARFDDSSFLDWLSDNEHILLNEKFPINEINKGSIYRKIKNFYESDLSDSDHLIDKMYEYRVSHCLSFAFRGQETDEVYIGKSDNNSYEISGPFGVEEIDLQDLISCIRRMLKENHLGEFCLGSSK